MRLAHVRRDETPLLPAESVIRRWAAEESGDPWILPHREAVLAGGWFVGVILSLLFTLAVFNGGYAVGQSEAFTTCSSWRLK